jgi:hypothetical protein
MTFPAVSSTLRAPSLRMLALGLLIVILILPL